ncbi:MAG: GrpB family protein, partial [Acidobacteriota bacterium]
FEHWDRLLFRDYLIEHPEVARDYRDLKLRLAREHAEDRVAYTVAKGNFILPITERAKRFYANVEAANRLRR